MAARVDAGHELGALLLLLRRAARSPPGSRSASSRAEHPPSERTRRLAGRGLLGGARARARRGPDRARRLARRHRRPDERGLEPAHRPAGAHARQHAGPARRHLVGARPLLGRGARRCTRTARWSAPAPAPTRPPATATATTATSSSATRTATCVQTLSDLGWIGLGLSLLRRARVGARPPRARSACAAATAGCRSTPSASALWTMAVVVVIFGVHSAIDWTWFVPGNVVPALLRAGWVAGRGPLRERLLRRAPRAAAGAASAPAAAPRAPPSPRCRRAARRRRAAAAVAAPRCWRSSRALVAAWAAYQPVRSVHAGDEALDRARRAARSSRPPSIAQIAVDRNPLSVDPLFELAAIEQARGQTPEAAGRARAGGRGRARQRRDVAPARPLPPRRARRAAQGARRLPGRLLPRPAEPAVVVGPDRGHPGRAGDAAAERLGAARRAPPATRAAAAAPPAVAIRTGSKPASPSSVARQRASAREEAQVLALRVEVRVEARERDHGRLDAPVVRAR